MSATDAWDGLEDLQKQIIQPDAETGFKVHKKGPKVSTPKAALVELLRKLATKAAEKNPKLS
ncbi:hypothetical protein LTR37_009939 [Vermiconidia calcicola]|uniref:Uncharacterized protein n=1 Tax=Vermiconidia calcicola TaxID=1690605 RepID=A0ACC3N7F8_9PEZI|nr:hypothetical protein LTR37_009939 [Vermiconidia calcicola]